jgi:hypothetical protein
VFGLPGHTITACKDIYCTYTTEVKIYSVKKYVTTYFPRTTEMLHFFLLGDSPASAFYVHLHRWRKQLTPPKTEQSIKKCLHMKFRRRGVTQKKEYNIQNMMEVWYQVYYRNVYTFITTLRAHYLTQATFKSEHVRVMYILCYNVNLMLQGTVAVSLPIRVANIDSTCNVCDAHNSG